MKTFYLLNRFGKDVIHKIYANNFDEAVKIFSKVKRLSTDDLLQIFIVRDQV
jgi:hypothetical protein